MYRTCGTVPSILASYSVVVFMHPPLGIIGCGRGTCEALYRGFIKHRQRVTSGCFFLILLSAPVGVMRLVIKIYLYSNDCLVVSVTYQAV